MGNDICKGEASESLEFPDQLNPENKQKYQMSTAVPYENGSSNHDISREEFMNSKIMEIQHQKIQPQFEPCKVVMHSTPHHNPIRYESMQVIHKNQKKKRINQFQLEVVPFSVIFLTITPGLKNTINQIGHDLFQKYFRESGAPSWKLHKNGFYINYLAKKLTAIITEEIYFEGELIEDEINRILPKSKGLLLNQFGRYEGEFDFGKANGKGMFEDRVKKAVYKGYWLDGKLTEGVIQSQQYRFKGKLQDCAAHGFGELYFKQVEVSYIGKFKKGEYYDKKALYECKDYIYQGCFINGKKNGEGTVVEKERDYKDKKIKYRPPCQYEGEFSNDIYLNKQAMKEMKEMKETQNEVNINNQNEILGKLFPTVRKLAFEDEDEVQEKPFTFKVGNIISDEELNQLKPKFVWVEPPKTQKKKKKNKLEEDDSQVF